MKQEDIEFLKQLQKAIKEGKRCGQREPAFWMIQEKVTYGNDDPEGADETILINCEGDILKNSDLEDVKDSLEEDAEDCYCEDELKECKSIQDIISFMESNDIKSSKDGYVRLSYIHSYYRLSDYSGPFLTYEDAKKHLEENRHNYPKEAYPFALTAYRNPNFERLWKIVMETNWNEEKGAILK